MRILRVKQKTIMKKSSDVDFCRRLVGGRQHGHVRAGTERSRLMPLEYNQSTNRFGTINLLNGNFTKIASFGNTLINDVAYCPTNGTLYGISNTAALVTFNKTNGAMAKIANLSMSGIESLAFRPERWSAVRRHVEQAALHLNPANGTATSVGSYGAPKNLGHRAEHPLRAGWESLRQQYEHEHRYLSDQHHERRGDVDGRSRRLPLPDTENASSNMYGVFINLGTATNPSPSW